jgi:hypothetical protein
MYYNQVATIFPLKERMALVAASMIDDNIERKHAIEAATKSLKERFSGFFWDKQETAEMEALWDAQRAQRPAVEPIEAIEL